MLRLFSTLLIAAIASASEIPNEETPSQENLDKISQDHYGGGTGIADSKTKYIITDPTLVEKGLSTISGQQKEPAQLYVEFYYKNNAVTNVREFHGNVYLTTSFQVPNNSEVEFGFYF